MPEPPLAARADVIAQYQGDRFVEGSRNGQPVILRLLNILTRRKWLILGALALAAIVGVVVTLLTTPQFTARATVEIQRETLKIVQVEGVEPERGALDAEFYQTQYGLLRARSLAERVAGQLRLHESAAFFQYFDADQEAEQLSSGPPAGTSRAVRDARVARAAQILLDHIAIAPVRGSRLVEVQFTSPDRQLSAQVANAWTRGFIETTLERRFEATSYARQFLEQRLEQMRSRLEQSERQLVAYASQQRIINIPSGTASEADGTAAPERSLQAEDLAALNRELNLATAARVSAQSRLNGGRGTSAEALTNPAIATLRERRATLAGEYQRMLSQFDPEYPPAQAIANQLRELARSIGQEEQRVTTSLSESYRSAVAREQDLQGRVEQLQRNFLDLRNRTIQYNIYQREVDTNSQLYRALLQRYREVGIAGGVGVNNVAVVDAAQVPEGPSSPSLPLNLVLALLVGAVVGGGLAFGLEQIDETLSDPTAVEEGLGLPLLGAIPKSESADALAELEDPKSSLAEAYLSAQTHLAFTTDHGVPRSFAVTSTRPGEGKSTTSFALARSLARTGRSVVLVDGDMRSPSMHHLLEVDNAKGLSNYLSGTADLPALVRGDLANGIALLTAGPMPPNAAELLTGERLKRLVSELQGQFDHVIIDAPPVVGLADTPLIAGAVEGVVFVVESHSTKRGLARVAIARLQDAGTHMLGALLTKFQAHRASYGYGYDYGYGYGDGSKTEG